MKHIHPFACFIVERKDNEIAAVIAKIAENFFVRIKKQVIDTFNKHVSDCEQYSMDTCREKSDFVGSISFYRLSGPPTPIVIRPTNRFAGAAFEPTSKVIEVYNGELLDLLEKFEEACMAALGNPDPDTRWEQRDDAAVLKEKIEEYDCNKSISNLSHELVHYYDSIKTTKKGGSIAHVMDYAVNKKLNGRVQKHINKMANGVWKDNIDLYKKSLDYADFAMNTYANQNHEYNAFFTSYASDLKRDLAAGKPLPPTFQEFKEMSINDYKTVLRFHRFTAKNQRAIIKRMYDLYQQLR